MKRVYTNGTFKPIPYKYETTRMYYIHVPELEYASHSNGYLQLRDGWLRVFEGYRWDGPSGPTIDTPDTMTASLFHDALYQLMREGVLDYKKWRAFADLLFYDILKQEGHWFWRPRYFVWYRTVRRGAESAAKPPGGQKEVT